MKSDIYDQKCFGIYKKPSNCIIEKSLQKLPPIEKPQSQKASITLNEYSYAMRKQPNQITPKDVSIGSSQLMNNKLFFVSQRKNQNENSSINKLQNFYHVIDQKTSKNKSIQDVNKSNSFYQNLKLNPLSINRKLSEEKQLAYFNQEAYQSTSYLKKKFNNVSNYFEKLPKSLQPSRTVSSDKYQFEKGQHANQEPIKHISMDALDNFFKFQIPTLNPSKHSQKKAGKINCFAANTHQGLVRNYNEDRVSIILNIVKPSDKILKPNEKWPYCSFFAIFDGHGGKKCAEFLRDHLHQFIINHYQFPSNPIIAIQAGCQQAEEHFLSQAESTSPIEKSGSCANFILIVDDTIYSCNVGDSRSIISYDNSARIEQLTIDHKPEEKNELKRIIAAGGKIYQSQGPKIIGTQFNGAQIIGPYRVYPGRLSVSRTFGDIEAKLSKYGGNQKVIIATPDIETFQIKDSMDYIVIGCDGIFDKMSNTDVSQAIQNSRIKGFPNVHEFAANAVENIIQNSFQKKTLDNVTVVIIGFRNFKKNFPKQQKVNNLLTLTNEETKQNPSFFTQTSKLNKQINKTQNLIQQQNGLIQQETIYQIV